MNPFRVREENLCQSVQKNLKQAMSRLRASAKGAKKEVRAVATPVLISGKRSS